MRKLIWLFAVIFMLAIVSSEPVLLYNISVDTNGSWQFDDRNYVYVVARDINGTLIDVDNITINLLSDVNFSESKNIYRYDIGSYKKFFIINETANITSVNLSVNVIKGVKSINKEITVNMQEDTMMTTIKEYAKNTYDKFKDSVIKNWLVGIVILFALLTLIVFIDLFFKKRRKNE